LKLKVNLGIVLLFWGFTTLAQMRIVPIQRFEVKQNQTASRIEATHLTLPFWDDFSTSVEFPSIDKWANGADVWVSHGAGINPPTVNMATFDGIDGLGKPYSLDPLSDGLTDILTSKMFDLSLYLPTDNLFLSFYYQAQGNGEIPNPNDSLRLEFKNNLGNWVKAWSVTGINVVPDQFILVTIPIDKADFFHPDFEFQFKSYGRQSGPFDNWHLDYLYLNKAVSDFNFPDRALQKPASGLFKNYTSIPIHHYKGNPAAYSNFASASAFNLHNLLQPSNFTMVAEINNLLPDLSYSLVRDTLSKATISSFPDPFGTGIRQIDLVAEKNLDPLKITSDTLADITLKLYMNTDDNTAPDYDPVIYAPLDFKENDTTYTQFTLHDYYSYDDGTAEYGAGLNYSGDMVVVGFPMHFANTDTLVSIDLYFPNIGVSNSPVIDLIILNDLNGKPNLFLHDETITLKQSTKLNEFVNYPLSKPIIVKDLFYIGWRQAKSGNLNIGLDKNNDSGTQIFYNLDGTWQQNTSITGSLMLRPHFGKADIITGLKIPETQINIYPNPGTGLFHINKNVEVLSITDMNGKQIEPHFQTQNNITNFDLSGFPKGVYLVHLKTGNTSIVRRIVKI